MQAELELRKRWRNEQFRADHQSHLDALLVHKRLEGKIDLRGLVVGLDGGSSSLIHADFQNAVIDGLDLSQGAFSCGFRATAATNCCFAQTFFDTCRFKGARFSRCSFDSAQFDSPTFDDAQFVACSFEQTRFYGRGMMEYGGRRITFEDCVFKSALFENLQLRACRFRNCIFENVAFKRCILPGTRFEGREPEPSAFAGCQ
jgi:uncharacterized protein YjbI with pentapeptide repeats